MSQDIPVVCIHRGGQKYFRIVLDVAGKHNRMVYAIGSPESKGFTENWVDMDSLVDDRIRLMEKVYFHLSSNTPAYETACIVRWLVLLNFCKNYGFESVMAIDSDLLLYAGAAEIVEHKEKVYFSFSLDEKGSIRYNTCSGHLFYAPVSKLEDFCNFIIDVYQNRTEVLKNLYAEKKKTDDRATVSDMDLLLLWGNRNRECIISTDTLYDHLNGGGGGYCDHNVNCSTGCLMQPYIKIKKIRFQSHVPYFYSSENKRMVRAFTIHAQGDSKMFIPLLADENNRMIFYYGLAWIKAGIRKVIKIKKRFIKRPVITGG